MYSKKHPCLSEYKELGRKPAIIMDIKKGRKKEISLLPAISIPSSRCALSPRALKLWNGKWPSSHRGQRTLFGYILHTQMITARKEETSTKVCGRPLIPDTKAGRHWGDNLKATAVWDRKEGAEGGRGISGANSDDSSYFSQ